MLATAIWTVSFLTLLLAYFREVKTNGNKILELIRRCNLLQEDVQFWRKNTEDLNEINLHKKEDEEVLKRTIERLRNENRIYKTFLNRLNINVELKDLKDEDKKIQ